MKTIVSWIFRVLALAGAGAAFYFYTATNGIVDVAKAQKAAEEIAHTNTKATLKETTETLAMEKGNLEKAKEQLQTEQSKTSDAEAKADKALREMTALESDKKKAESERKQLSQKVAELNKELAEEKNKQPEVSPEEYKAAKTQITELEGKLAKVNEELEVAKDTIKKSVPPNTLASATKPKAVKTSNTEAMPVGKSTEAKEANAPLLGVASKILAIQHDIGMVVVEIGSSKGVTEGAILTITVGNRLMAKIQVTRVMDEQSIGIIMPGQGAPLLLRDNDAINISL